MATRAEKGLGSIALGQDLTDLAESTRGLLRRHADEDTVRAAVEVAEEERPTWWKEIADHGLLGLHLPEDQGGAGFGLEELAVVVEETGRLLLPGPFVPTVLASAVLAAAGHTRFLPGLADGQTTAAVDLSGAATTLVADREGDLVVSGTSTPIIGGQLADLLVLPVRVDDETCWVVVERDRVDVVAEHSHDLTRRLATVRVSHLQVPRDDVLALDPQTPRDLAAVVLAAEAVGIADWATATAADYATTRQQFGRPIGQFQAVKHRVARMLTRTEQARACAWDAARAADDHGRDGRPEQASLAAATAATIAVPAGLACVQDLVNTLGGVGYTWEHVAGFALRRTMTSTILLGAADGWATRVADLALAGHARPLSLELPPEAEAVRRTVAAELEPLVGADDAVAQLAERGYTAPHFPAPWGKDADPITQVVIAQELERTGLVPHDMIIGNWAVPTLIAHGSEDLVQRLVPPSLRGDLTWCQMFSEPGAGSDLAALSTRAVKVDGGWRVNGQKVWTSGALESDVAILLARTDQDAPKHKGLSYFVLDMSTPGIDIRPLRELTGGAHFNEVFLDDVLIPDDMLVGEPGEGWRLAITTLANERVHMTSNSATGLQEQLFDHVDRTSPSQLARTGQLLAEAQGCGLLGLRQTMRAISGLRPGAESSVAKLVTVQNIQETRQALVEFQGAAALTVDPDERSDTWWFLNSRALSIAGGTTDVQLNIIAERLLGLPRDPAPERTRP